MDSWSLVSAKEALDDLGDPEQHFVEAKQSQKQLRFIIPLSLGKREVQPHPHIAQHQGDAHEQQSLAWVARAGANPRLVHLSVAGFDAKSFGSVPGVVES